MKLYCKSDSYKLYNGSMIDMEEVIAPNSIDSIVTDPPYELNFMGKSWDNSGIAFQKETWRKCYNVLKLGGYLLAFGGTRTYHRIACAIEDAGFEIRDCIMWLYGCLSNDTQILTNDGWKNSDTIKVGDYIYSLDLQKNKIVKNKVKNVFKYDYDGEMVNLKNQNTNQLLTPNHHCIVKDKIKTRVKGNTNYNSHDYWVYKDAWQIRSASVTLPLAAEYDGSIKIGNLLSELLGWVISEGHYLKDTNAIMITQSSVNKQSVSRIRYILGKLKIKYREYSRQRTYNGKPYTEYDWYIGVENSNIINTIKRFAPNKKMSWECLELSLTNKEFLLKGLCGGDGAKSNTKFGFSGFYQKDIEQLQIFQVLLHLTGKQGWINEKRYCCSIHSNPTTELQGKHYKDRFIKYNGGYVWCIETEIGNFVAKRDGKVFITGNSGFPKSMNIGKAMEAKLTTGSSNKQQFKHLDGEKTESGNWGISKFTKNQGFRPTDYSADGHLRTTKVNYHTEAKEWDGWGTALKPAYEPIIVARKPLDGTIVDNVLKWGVSGINIDECRVETTDINRKGGATTNGNLGWKPSTKTYNDGRFPANVIHDGSEEATNDMQFDCDGGAARYFYCAKASKRDRDDGLYGFEEKSVTDGCERSNFETGHAFGANSCPRKNSHPTVKPVALMQYLVRLVTPKGGIVLDPFNGSGSTGKAVMYENNDRNAHYKYIGIELTEEYLPISRARIDFATLDKSELQSEYEETAPKNERKEGQISIFD